MYDSTKKMGILTREGGRKDGCWEFVLARLKNCQYWHILAVVVC